MFRNIKISGLQSIHLTFLFLFVFEIAFTSVNGWSQVLNPTQELLSLVVAPVSSTRISPDIPESPSEIQDEFVSESSTVGIPVIQNGPGQPESSGFSITSSDEMVDPFTGDFSYSIPLMDVEGYPITISYNSNIGMNDEASWVGLGWNLNVGSISREMRGVPDDFTGNQNIVRVHSQLNHDVTNGFKFGVTGAVAYKSNFLIKESKIGSDISLIFGKYKDSYSGWGKTFDFNIGGSLGLPLEKDGYHFGPKVSLGYSRDTKGGISTSSSLGLMGSYQKSNGGGVGADIGLAWQTNRNSRAGISSRSLSPTADLKMRDVQLPVGSMFGSSWTCGTQTSTPRIEFDGSMSNVNNTLDLTVGTNISADFYLMGGMHIQDFNSSQSLKSFVQSKPAVGYMHSKNHGSAAVIMDFNREAGEEFSQNMKSTNYSFPTYDIFYVNGMGLSSTFRAHRRDVGVYSDASTTTDIDGKVRAGQLGGILDLPKVKLAVGYSETNVDGAVTSGGWYNSGSPFNFGPDEAVFYKGIGEPTPVNTELFDNLGKEDPIYLGLVKSTGSTTEINKTTTAYAGSTSISMSGLSAYNKPDTRATLYKPLRASEIGSDNMRVYNANSFGQSPGSSAFTRIDATHLSNHISAIEVKTPQGMNYYYGLPTYTLTQSTVMFSIASTTPDAQGLATYSGTENSTSNTSGKGQLYDQTTVPGYASAFLLSSVTTDDYLDRTGDGFTLDDPGNYYKFNYTRKYNDFLWRFPVDKAFYNENMLSLDNDNMASYMSGKKEIWYTHSVESKNLIAEFTLLDRDDVCSSNNETTGGLNYTKCLQKLQKITLYNRNERLANPNARPLQIVEFIYDYSLCKNNPTNKNTASNPDGSNTGKLTLLEIRVYSGEKSEETALTPYKFKYAENPKHNYKNVDRWGSYDEYNSTTDLPREWYPYANQNKAEADLAAAAWRLSEITFPAGGKLNIHYEADSYSFVQNKRAMKQTNIVGYMSEVELAELRNETSWNGTSFLSQDLQKNMSAGTFQSLGGITSGVFNVLKLSAGYLDPNVSAGLLGQLDALPNNVVIVKLDESYIGLTDAQADVRFRNEYLNAVQTLDPAQGMIKELYLRNFVRIKSGSGYELIPTFANIRQTNVSFGSLVPGLATAPPTGIMPQVSGEHQYGYIVLQNVYSIDEADANRKRILMQPVQKTAMEFSRTHLTDITFGTCDGCETEEALNIDRKSFWKGDVYPEMAKYGYCGTISTTMPSQVRLFDSDNLKYGGNGRVSGITLSDSWDDISKVGEASGEEESVYSWVYKYHERTSSDGVAAYEPMTGNDENPFFAWDRYTNKSVSYPDPSKFTVKPVGASLFPAPVVGYEEVEKAFNLNWNSSQRFTFHTAKQYPTLSNSSIIVPVEADKTSFLKTEIDLFAFSQGHSVVTNDFHGKPKSVSIKNDAGDEIHGVTYVYKALRDKVKMLDNNSTTVYPETVAMEYDISADTRMMETSTTSVNIGALLFFPLLPIPSFIPTGGMPIFKKSVRKTAFYLHTINKHTNYSAVLQEVITTDFGSKSTNASLLYDRHSGDVLLSSSNDEFDDKIYSFSYPAHWYYTSLRNPSEQPTAGVSGTLTAGIFTASGSLENKFFQGDLVTVSGTSLKAYVYTVSGTSMTLIAINGTTYTAVSGARTITLSKSSLKNNLMAGMSSVVTKRNPLNGTFTFPQDDILDAGAMTLDKRLNVRCIGAEPMTVTTGQTINPFTYGIVNNLFMDQTYVVKDERSSVQVQGNRFNGTLANYWPFYELTGGKWYKIGEPGYPDSTSSLRNWRSTGTLLTLDENGKALDQIDPVDVVSAVLYGYNRYNKLVPVAQATNSRYFEIAYDGMEDYSYYNPASVNSGHFDFASSLSANIAIDNTVRHSGTSSLRIGQGLTATTERKTTTGDCDKKYVPEGTFVVSSCNCVKPFEPVQTEKYIVSLWVKGKNINTTTNAYDDVSITVSFSGSVTTFVGTPSGQIIDGWQRIEKEFTVPSVAGNPKIYVALANTSSVGGTQVYFDDIRIHPLLAAMTTTVYDPVTLVPLATHDGYNFTTFFNYDENLIPIGARVETIEGIQTVTQTESGNIKSYKQ